MDTERRAIAGVSANPGAPVHRSSRTLRLLAGGIVVAVLAVAGTFVVAVLVRGPAGWSPRPADSGMAGMAGMANGANAKRLERFAGVLGAWRYNAAVTLDASAFALSIDLVDAAGVPAPPTLRPLVRLTMVDHAMSSNAMALEPVGAGRFTTRGTLSMQGRWRFDIALPDAATALNLQVPSP